MYLFHSWKESLKFFIPGNLKLFLLVYLKNLLTTYKKYLKYGWPLFLITFLDYIVLSRFMGWVFSENSFIHDLWLSFFSSVKILLHLAYFFLIALLARPSVEQKNCAYIRSYVVRYDVFPLYLIVRSSFVLLTVMSFYVGSFLLNGSLIFLYYQLFMEIMVFTIFSPLVLFFMLDLNNGFKSIFKNVLNTFKMILYNLPVMMVMAIIVRFFEVFFHYVVSGYAQQYASFIYLLQPLWMPLWICFFGVYYTKKVHDQSRLYVGK